MQSFTPGAPILNSLAVSQVVRDNFTSLLGNNSGGALPAYAVEGMQWYDTGLSRMTIAKFRGTKAYAWNAMGAIITLFQTLKAAGTDGSTVALDLRIQDSTLLVGDKDWTNSPAQKLYYSTGKNPSYFAAKKWNDPLVDDPVLYTLDGKLLGKTWDAFAPLVHEIVYATGFFVNEANFLTSILRAVDVEPDFVNYEADFHAPGGLDHVQVQVVALNWHDIQNGKGSFKLLKDGAEMDPATYAIRPRFTGGTIFLVIYSIDPTITDLVPFSTTARYTLKVRKAS